jgi:plasmid stabilization system protein ParE
MIYRVVIAEAAWSDMFEIGRRIKPHNPLRAGSFIDELYQRCNSLGDFPESYVLIADPKSRAIRRVVHGDYLIFFRIVAATVEVLHVLHGARDYEHLLFPEDER